jgi:ABC-type antimicrobial peptide transport system permease subunit
MVLQSSLRVVAAGAAIGIVAAVVAARAIASQLPGVTPTDPTTYLGVAGLLVVAAMAAAWWPARRASRVDPAVTLRGQ